MEFLSLFRNLSGGWVEGIYERASKGLPGDSDGKESACQCRRCKRRGFDYWVGKIP